MVKAEKASVKYVVANGSEGEPGVFKDKWVLENHPDLLIYSIKLAMKTVGAKEAYIYLNKNYYKKFGAKLRKIIGKSKINLFAKRGGYIAGEETALLNDIEGRIIEPRSKPPYPTQAGLWGKPTLINNIETFYSVALVVKGKFNGTRLYSISGDVKKSGVFELPNNLSVRTILKETKNYPDFDFFAQVGGGAIGEIFLEKELNQKVGGAGSIQVFNKKKTKPFELMKFWAKFFMEGNCDKCTPCREGVFQIFKMMEKRKIEKKKLAELLEVLEKTSFCALGKGVTLPYRSFIKKILNEKI